MLSRVWVCSPAKDPAVRAMVREGSEYQYQLELRAKLGMKSDFDLSDSLGLEEPDNLDEPQTKVR